MAKKSTKKSQSKKTTTKKAKKKTPRKVKPTTSVTETQLKEALIPPTEPKKRFGFSSGMLFLGCMFVGLGIGQLAGMAGTGILIGMGAGFLAMFYSRE